jgi:hypothetical protein
LPEKAGEMLYKYLQIQVDAESAETLFKRREETNSIEEKKS